MYSDSLNLEESHVESDSQTYKSVTKPSLGLFLSSPTKSITELQEKEEK